MVERFGCPQEGCSTLLGTVRCLPESWPCTRQLLGLARPCICTAWTWATTRAWRKGYKGEAASASLPCDLNMKNIHAGMAPAAMHTRRPCACRNTQNGEGKLNGGSGGSTCSKRCVPITVVVQGARAAQGTAMSSRKLTQTAQEVSVCVSRKTDARQLQRAAMEHSQCMSMGGQSKWD